MTLFTPEALVAQLRWRYATKQFDATKKIPADVWAALEQALILTPSSFGLQPWKFLVVTNPTVKQALVAASWNQSQPLDCSHHVVLAANTQLGEVDVDRFLDSTISARGGSRESLVGYRGMITGFAAKAAKEGWISEWAKRQAYIALGNFMTCCATLGVDACPMEGIAADKYDEILGLTSTPFRTVVACATGYRAVTDKYADLAKVRFPASEIIQHV